MPRWLFGAKRGSARCTMIARISVREAAMGADPERLNNFLGRMLGDMGATLSASLIVVGDRLGLYKAMQEGGPMDAATLAKRTGTAERYVREWLAAQAASGYVTHD